MTMHKRLQRLEITQREQDLAQAQRIVNFLRQNPDSTAAKRIVEILDLARERKNRFLTLEQNHE